MVGEWMPIRIFYNFGGALTEVTEKYGLENTQGWWNTVSAEDFNKDGFIDLVVGNLGLNSFLKASEEKPIQLFIDDFSGNNKLEQILSYYHGSKFYPLGSRDQFVENIPSLQTKFSKYADFAGKSIEDIFQLDQLKKAKIKKAVVFASVILLNNGDETFTRKILPMEAQYSPVYTILIDDFDKNGSQDLLLGGNFSGVPADLGRYDASFGSLLLGDGTGSFMPASLQQSGFVVTGEVRQFKIVHNASDRRLIVAARNNDTILTFQLNK